MKWAMLFGSILDEYFDLQGIMQSTYNGAGGYTLFRTYPEITESGLYTKDILLNKLLYVGWKGR